MPDAPPPTPPVNQDPIDRAERYLKTPRGRLVVAALQVLGLAALAAAAWGIYLAAPYFDPWAGVPRTLWGWVGLATTMMFGAARFLFRPPAEAPAPGRDAGGSTPTDGPPA